MNQYIGRICRPQRASGIAAAFGIGAVLALGGCASYREKPIDPMAVEGAWRAIDPTSASESVRRAMEVGQLKADRFDLSDGISLAEAEIAALFFNPSIRATRMQIGIPEAEAAHAKLWEDPELDVDGEYILADVDEPLIFGTGLSITIPLSGRPAVAKKLAESRVDEREAAAVGAEWALLVALRRDWLHLAAQEARITVLKDSQAALQTLVDLVPKFRAAQAVTVVDERWLILQQKTLMDALQQAEAERDEYHLAVIALMGLHPSHEWSIEARMADLNKFNRSAELNNLLAHPTLRRVLAAYQVAERQLQLEVRKQYPDLKIGFGGGVEEGDPRIALGFSLLPIPVWNRNRQGIAMATVERDVVAENIRAALQELTQADRKARVREELGKKRLQFFERELVPLADQQVTDARRLTSLGQLDLFMLADAVELARNIRLDLLDVQIAHRTSVLERDSVAGPVLDRSKNIDPEDEPSGVESQGGNISSTQKDTP